jgi:hypothetical protein
MASRQALIRARLRAFLGLVALCGLGSTACFDAASAKGLAAGRGFVGLRSGMQAHGQIFRPAIRPARTGAFGFRGSARPRAFYLGVPWLMGYDDQGPYYYSYGLDAAAAPDENGLASPPLGPSPNQPAPVVVFRPGCRTQAQTVPAEAGGTTTVSVTRCY